LPKIFIELFEMKIPFNSIDNLYDGTDILVEDLSLLQTFKGYETLVRASVAGSLKSWNLFLRGHGTVTGELVNREDAAGSPRSCLVMIWHERTHQSLVLSCLLQLLSGAWHCSVDFLFLSKYNLWG
jgi:hypothetical protein